MVPHARFTELLNDIEPSPTTKSNASSAHNNLRDYLRRHKTFKEKLEREFLAGSYCRQTAIRPRSTEDGVERPDVDIIVVTKYSTNDKPEAVLFELRDALEPEYKVERVNMRSVRVTTTNAEMDVVPVIGVSDSFVIADREHDEWKPTNPPKHTDWSAEQNTRFAGRFKPLVKMLKWWRRENLAGSRPKGFVLELLLALHAPPAEEHYGEAFAKALETIHRAYGTLATSGQKPQIWDPAIVGNDVLSKVSLPQWKAFIEKVGVHAKHAREAQNTDDMERATKLWRKVFDRFKATANPAKATAATSVAASVGSSSYTFPNTDAAPKKPRGFA